MSSITDPEVRAFLTEGTRTGKLSFLSPSGHPLVTPVWFVLEGDTVVFNTGSDTAKGRYLARDPRVSLCVDLEAPPYAFVQVQGYHEGRRPVPDGLTKPKINRRLPAQPTQTWPPGKARTVNGLASRHQIPRVGTTSARSSLG
jgi:PPOX class probable F420-dependent enzyme